MPKLKDIPRCSSTTVADGLSEQILAEMNLLVPGILVDFSDLNVEVPNQQFPFLQQRAKNALARAIANRGRRLELNSGYRTCAQQFLLRRFVGHCGITAAAKPGSSNHESGLSIDIDGHAGWRPFLEAEGWHWFGGGDAVHFDFFGGGVPIGHVGIKAFQTLWNRNFPNQQIGADGSYGPETAEKLAIAPSEGFNNETSGRRMLRLMDPLMRGGDVRRVQTKLKEFGFLSAADIDGVFGEDTETAVKRFQEAEGLEADGIVGDDTFEKLGIELA